MSQRSKLRVGVIGTGDFAQACHIPGVQSHPDAEVVALCGRREAVTRELADRFGIADVYTDYRTLCESGDVEAITIATPNVWHAEQALCALRHRKHAFCEKPLALTVRQAEEMWTAAEASGRVHMVAFTYRYCYGVQELRRRIQAGEIGTPHYLRVQFDSWEGLDPNWTIGWRENKAVSGGGFLFDRGAHLFDLAQFLLGPIDAVTGFHHLIRGRQQPAIGSGTRREVETDDVAAAWFHFASGARGQWFVSRVSPPFASNSFVQVIGDHGALQAAVSRGSADSLHVSDPTAPAWTAVPLPPEASDGRPHALQRMMHGFVDACLRGTVSEGDGTFADGLSVQRAIDAVLQATANPAWIQLPRRP